MNAKNEGQANEVIKSFQTKIHQYIESNPNIMMGKPIIKGTRITIELILERISEGETIQSILIAYPHITQDDIFAALAFQLNGNSFSVI